MVENFKTILNFICSPKEMWQKVAEENREATEIQTSFFYPLLACVAAAPFVGALFSSGSFVFSDCLVFVAVKFASLLSTYFLDVFVIISVLERFWNVKCDYNKSVRFITYSFSLMLGIELICSLSESFFFLKIANIYAAFIIWEGLSVLFPIFDTHYSKTKWVMTLVTFLAICIPSNVIYALFYAFIAIGG